MSVDHATYFANKLRKGSTLLYPTDTIWGIGCDAYNIDAIEQIYQAKSRDQDKPLIVLVDTIEHLKRLIVDIHPRLETILHYYHKPVTVIYKSNKILPDKLATPQGTIAIRIVDHPFCRSLIRQLGKPIVSTSANIQGLPFPKNFDEIDAILKNEIDEIVIPEIADTIGHNPSVIMSCDQNGELKFIRD